MGEYRTLDGELHQKTGPYLRSGPSHPDHAVGDSVEVLYLSEDPSVYRIADENMGKWTALPFLIAGPLLLLLAAGRAGLLPAPASTGAAAAGALLAVGGTALVIGREWTRKGPPRWGSAAALSCFTLLSGLLLLLYGYGTAG
ncbi:hypothetical protein [Nocardiopsis potens]|uniref:hypothetical protein n=1 Tax=Nocardiopsis potens TaxID=1246458 RepID=UPI0019D3F76E|nr:hypothetical protein [Nocardiopsis potens]